MILWTIQTNPAWETLQRTGILRADPARIMDEYYTTAYTWMTDQMAKRIGPGPTEDALPLWGWYQWRGAKCAKPDLRARAHLDKGVWGVRIEFEIADELVLLSDFSVWHCVLNYTHLPISEEDSNAFDAEITAQGIETGFGLDWFTNSPYRQRIVESWQRIFDLDFVDKERYVTERTRAEKPIQATFWELPLANARRVTHFRGR